MDDVGGKLNNHTLKPVVAYLATPQFEPLRLAPTLASSTLARITTSLVPLARPKLFGMLLFSDFRQAWTTLSVTGRPVETGPAADVGSGREFVTLLTSLLHYLLSFVDGEENRTLSTLAIQSFCSVITARRRAC